MVICSKCCDYYQLKKVEHDIRTNRYYCVFTCDCSTAIRLEESEAEQKGYLTDEDTQEMLHEQKIAIIQALIKSKHANPPFMKASR